MNSQIDSEMSSEMSSDMNSGMSSKGESDMSQSDNAHDTVVKLVKQAKHRPLPRSTKVLFYIVIIASVFTGGAAYGKHKAAGTSGSGLSLSALGGSGGFGGGFGAGFGGGRVRGNGAGAASGTGNLALNSDGSAGAATTTTAVASDVAGTVVSITAKSVVIATLSGGNQTFPITSSTKVRSSAKIDLSAVKAGDIVTIKPDDASAAKTIMVVK